jgi:hypothetical protein
MIIIIIITIIITIIIIIISSSGVKRNRTFYYSMNGASDNNINPRSVPLYYFRHNGFQKVMNVMSR